MSGHRPQVTKVWNFVNDFREELPFVMSFPQYFKHHNYTVLGHSKLYHPGALISRAELSPVSR